MPEELGAFSPQVSAGIGEGKGTWHYPEANKLNQTWNVASHCMHTSLSIFKFITLLFLSVASGFIIIQVIRQVCEVGTKVRQMLERTATGISWIAILHILFQARGVVLTLAPLFFPFLSSIFSTWTSWGQEDPFLQTGPLPLTHADSSEGIFMYKAFGIAIAGLAACWRRTHGG